MSVLYKVLVWSCHQHTHHSHKVYTSQHSVFSPFSFHFISLPFFSLFVFVCLRRSPWLCLDVNKKIETQRIRLGKSGMESKRERELQAITFCACVWAAANVDIHFFLSFFIVSPYSTQSIMLLWLLLFCLKTKKWMEIREMAYKGMMYLSFGLLQCRRRQSRKEIIHFWYIKVSFHCSYLIL